MSEIKDFEVRVNTDNLFPKSLDSYPYWWEKEFWIYQSKGECSYVFISPKTIYDENQISKSVSLDYECIAIRSDVIPKLKDSIWWRNCQGSELPKGMNWPPQTEVRSFFALQVNVDVNLKDIHQVVTIDCVSQEYKEVDQHIEYVGNTIVDVSYPSDEGISYYHVDLATMNLVSGSSYCRKNARNLDQASPEASALIKNLMLHDLDGDKLLKGLIAQSYDVNRYGKIKLTSLYGSGWRLDVDGVKGVPMQLIMLIHNQGKA